jgi:hypothetical protein
MLLGQKANGKNPAERFLPVAVPARISQVLVNRFLAAGFGTYGP